MKLNIDLDNKIVKVDNKVNIKELIDILKSMFPDTWKEFELDTNIVNVTVKESHTNIPNIPNPYLPPYNPINPFSPYVVTFGTTSPIENFINIVPINTNPTNFK